MYVPYYPYEGHCDCDERCPKCGKKIKPYPSPRPVWLGVDWDTTSVSFTANMLTSE